MEMKISKNQSYQVFQGFKVEGVGGFKQ